MTKNKNTKRAMLASVLSVMLCCAMLVGSTFAWFTDSATSGKNTIVAGNLDIELQDADGNTLAADASLFDDEFLWEPGAVLVSDGFKVANVGTLALTYDLALNVVNENSLNGNTLADVIKVAVVDKAPTSRDAAIALDYVALSELKASGELLPENADALTVVLYWEPTANDNDYNVNNGQKTDDDKDALTIEFGVSLFATQTPEESDSFGKDYDKNAWLELSAVDNGNGTYESDGQLYVKYNGKYIAVTESKTTPGLYSAEDGDKYVTNALAFVAASKEGGNTAVLQDIETTDESANRVYLTKYICEKDLAFDFDGNTVTYNEMKNHSPIEIGTGKNAVLENGTVTANGTMSFSYAVVKINGKTNATLNNLTIDASNTVAGAAFSIIDMGTSATISNSTLIGSVNALYVSNETTLILSNCTVSGLLYVDRGTVYIASGDYSQMTLQTLNTCHITIESGTFGFDPSDYTTNTVYENGDGTWTVSLIDEGDFEDPFGD